MKQILVLVLLLISVWYICYGIINFVLEWHSDQYAYAADRYVSHIGLTLPSQIGSLVLVPAMSINYDGSPHGFIPLANDVDLSELISKDGMPPHGYSLLYGDEDGDHYLSATVTVYDAGLSELDNEPDGISSKLMLDDFERNIMSMSEGNSTPLTIVNHDRRYHVQNMLTNVLCLKEHFHSSTLLVNTPVNYYLGFIHLHHILMRVINGYFVRVYITETVPLRGTKGFQLSTDRSGFCPSQNFYESDPSQFKLNRIFKNNTEFFITSLCYLVSHQHMAQSYNCFDEDNAQEWYQFQQQCWMNSNISSEYISSGIEGSDSNSSQNLRSTKLICPNCQRTLYA